MVEISATTKLNLDKLVEAIILQAEILDLKTDFESKATGIVLESNEGSCKAFINAGFRENHKKNIDGNMCRIFHWELDQKLPLG